MPKGQRKCSSCRKVIRTKAAAAKRAREIREGTKTLAQRRSGRHKVGAYECPGGFGWHIGRRSDADLEADRLRARFEGLSDAEIMLTLSERLVECRKARND